MRIDYGLIPRDIVDTIHETWRRLPRDVQQALDHIRFTYRETSSIRDGYKALASAGSHDVDIYELPILTDAAVGVLAHECAHVALKHSQLLTAGQISEQEAERQADALMHQWGLTHELASRRLFIGR